MELLQLEKTEKRIKVILIARRAGEDLSVQVYGGEAHVGCVILAQPRPSLDDPLKPSATSSLISLLGHKDDVVLRGLAETLSKETGRTIALTGGLHWDSLTKEELETVQKLVNQLGRELLDLVEPCPSFREDREN